MKGLTSKAFQAVAALAISMAIGCSSLDQYDPKMPKKAKRPDIVWSAQWQESLPSGSFRSQTPTLITILQSGSPVGDLTDRDAYMKTQRQKDIQKGWGDLGAHFYVDPRGAIYQGRRMFLEGRIEIDREEEEFDASGHVFVVAMGDYDVIAPSEEFKERFLDLIAWLCQDHGILMENLKPLSDYLGGENPGGLLAEWLEGPEFHYPLLDRMGVPYDTSTLTETPQPTPTPQRPKKR